MGNVRPNGGRSMASQRLTDVSPRRRVKKPGRTSMVTGSEMEKVDEIAGR
jgi:hypothetical protein